MNVKERDPLGMSESPVWHIKGTATERVVQESRRAVGDYNQRCLFLWREILSSLENSLKLEVYPYSGKGDKPEGPHFFHQLVDLLYAELWSSLGAPMPTRTRFGWTTDAKDSTLFIALTKPVAVGRPTDYNTVIDGTENFIAEYWEPLQRRAVELDRLHGDLCYLRDIVADQLNNISAEDVGKGICPACPYPESRRIVSADPKTT